MVLSKHQELGTFVLMIKTNHLVSSKMLMNPIYKKVSESAIAFLVLYVDDILLIGNDIGLLTIIKVWLSNKFSMKDLGEVAYILGIRINGD